MPWVCRSVSCIFPVFPALFLCSALGGGGDKNVIHIASMHKTLVFTAFSPLVQYSAQGAGHVITSVHANCDDAQNTGIYCVFASLYNILLKDVEKEKLSQASMRTLVFTAFSPLCKTY